MSWNLLNNHVAKKLSVLAGDTTITIDHIEKEVKAAFVELYGDRWSVYAAATRSYNQMIDKLKRQFK